MKKDGTRCELRKFRWNHSATNFLSTLVEANDAQEKVFLEIEELFMSGQYLEEERLRTIVLHSSDSHPPLAVHFAERTHGETVEVVGVGLYL